MPTKYKLWNWYNESFDKKINDSNINYNNFLRQAHNVYNRKKRDLDLKKKIDKNLYIKAKINLKDEEKRAIQTLGISHKNEFKVIKETIKQLKIATDLKKLIKFEIKKIDLTNKEAAEYLNNYYNMLKNTADDIEVKQNNINKLIDSSLKKEDEANIKKAYLIIVYKLLKVKNDLLVSLEDIKNTSIKFNDFETMILSNNKHLENIKKLSKELIKKQDILLDKRNKIQKEYLEIKKQSKINFKKDKHQTKKEYKNRILEAEYSYNLEYQETLREYQEELKNNKLKIKEKKQAIEAKCKENIAKKTTYLNNKKQQEKALKEWYSTKKIWTRKNYLLKLKFKKIEIMNNFIEFDFQKAKDLFTLSKQELNKNFNSQNIKAKINAITEFNDFYKNIKQQTKNLEAKKLQKLKIILNNANFFIFELEKFYNSMLLVKAEYLQKLGNLQKDYTYNGDYNLRRSEAMFEYVKEWNKQINTASNEAIKTKTKILEMKNNKELEKIILEKKENFIQAKKDYQNRNAQLKELYKQKNFTKKAYDFKLKESKILYKESKNSIKLANEYEKNKIVKKTLLSRTYAKKRIARKIYDSKISEAIKQIPIENQKNARIKATLLNLLFPGLAQIFVFKQNKKGILMILLSILLYAVFVPFSLGMTWAKIGGIQGLIDLGASIHDSSKGITPDARYWMFGGVASIILLSITFAYVIASAVSAYRNGRFLEEGMRAQNWSHTKKWLSDQGFPWLISIPGWFLIAFIVVTPLLTSLLISFSNTGFNHEPPGRVVDWIGFSQYGKWWIFRENGLLTSLFRVVGWTLIWTFFSGLLVIIVGTLFAILVNSEKIKFKKFFRLVYIIPWAIPAFITIIFLKSIFQADESSLINAILLKVGLIDKSVNFFASVHLTRFLLIVIQTWLGHSYIFLLITGNLQSIPKDIYEAAEIDGAKRNKLFKNITMPILLNSLAPLLISQFVFMFNNFTIISLFSGGGPAYDKPTVFLEAGTDILISWIFKLTNGVVQLEGNVGFSSAMVVLASVISVSFAAYGFAKNATKRGK